MCGTRRLARTLLRNVRPPLAAVTAATVGGIRRVAVTGPPTVGPAKRPTRHLAGRTTIDARTARTAGRDRTSVTRTPAVATAGRRPSGPNVAIRESASSRPSTARGGAVGSRESGARGPSAAGSGGAALWCRTLRVGESGSGGPSTTGGGRCGAFRVRESGSGGPPATGGGRCRTLRFREPGAGRPSTAGGRSALRCRAVGAGESGSGGPPATRGSRRILTGRWRLTVPGRLLRTVRPDHAGRRHRRGRGDDTRRDRRVGLDDAWRGWWCGFADNLRLYGRVSSPDNPRAFSTRTGVGSRVFARALRLLSHDVGGRFGGRGGPGGPLPRNEPCHGGPPAAPSLFPFRLGRRFRLLLWYAPRRPRVLHRHLRRATLDSVRFTAGPGQVAPGPGDAGTLRAHLDGGHLGHGGLFHRACRRAGSAVAGRLAALHRGGLLAGEPAWRTGQFSGRPLTGLDRGPGVPYRRRGAPNRLPGRVVGGPGNLGTPTDRPLVAPGGGPAGVVVAPWAPSTDRADRAEVVVLPVLRGTPPARGDVATPGPVGLLPVLVTTQLDGARPVVVAYRLVTAPGTLDGAFVVPEFVGLDLDGAPPASPPVVGCGGAPIVARFELVPAIVLPRGRLVPAGLLPAAATA